MKVLPIAILGLMLSHGGLHADTAATEAFEGESLSRQGWVTTGKVGLDRKEHFEGQQALVLEKSEESLRAPVNALSPVHPVSGGKLEVEFAGRSDLTSMDNSYNGTLALEFFDKAGASLGATELGAWFRQTPWKKEAVTVVAPDGAVSARFVASINKETPGRFWLDALAVRASSSVVVEDGLKRMVLRFSELGHLLYPESPRVASVEVWSDRELSEARRKVDLVVRDYWGGEQGRHMEVLLEPAGKVQGKDILKYLAKVDLSSLPLEVGRYYELHGEIARPGVEAFSHSTSFAILPEAAANAFKPEEIPFTSRTWDQRFPESPRLTKRLGIRICNVWGRMEADPAKVDAAQIDLAHELGLGVLTSSPALGIEARSEGWRELLANDGALIRKGVRNFLAKYGHMKPMVVNLGNEPHSKGDEIKNDVEAYRIVYEEIKKIDPSIFVVGTSVGTEEGYFKQGFGQWLDAYDFHSYEDPESVRVILSEKYPELFRKYGYAKPIWSTEIGMNSQGLARLAVASLIYRKFANFFAGGGANVSWFGLFYPDPDARIHGTFAAAHNVFDCRFNQYAPKLDAIAYYNVVNSITTKKFVGDKVYGADTRMFLFQDQPGNALIIAYKDKGQEDVFLPLPGVGRVEMIRIDGSRNLLDAKGRGVSLTIGEEPVLLLFKNGGRGMLPASLGRPAAEFAKVPARFYRDGENLVEVALNDIQAEAVDLKAPPFWSVDRSVGGGNVRFSVNPPADTQASEAGLDLHIREGDSDIGLLSVRRPLAGLVDVRLMPVPYGAKGGPGVRLMIQNNGGKPQKFSWQVEVTGEQTLQEGRFFEVVSSKAKFQSPDSGDVEVAARSHEEILLPLSGAGPLDVYHVKAVVRDAAGKVVSLERQAAGFVGVPRALAPVKVDGLLNEPAWQSAPVQTLEEARQFFGFALGEREAPVWKGPADLSAQLRFLWDERSLYVAVTVHDDIAGGSSFEDAELWRMDGLQFLIDPARQSKEKPGKYEYSLGLGRKGPQSWCTLSADAGAPTGDARDIQLAIHRDKAGTGDVTYEVAIPWQRLAPFVPEAGGNLGFTMIVNEDDGEGRDAFMTWFGNAHTKDVDTVGDLMLLP